ncbi:MAG: S8 family serine peptidase [Sphingomonadaceae bacterium]|nr:S8 family serine peptidase [Sphingomonadaceae bacterium]
MRHGMIMTICAMLLPTAAAMAQLALPAGGLPRVELPELPVDLPQTGEAVERLGRTLEAARLDRLNRFVRQNREAVDFDENRFPAVRGVLVATGVSDSAIAAAQDAGFKLLSRDAIEGLDLSYVRFATPAKMSLGDAEKKLRAILPDAEIDADHIYFQSGAAPDGNNPPLSGVALATSATTTTSLGIIDGGVADHPSVRGRVRQNGFAKGAPSPSSHGTSVAALMIGNGEIRGARAGASLLAADVYGTDKAGGNASAIARGLGWLTSQGVSVVTISLVGPHNALLKSAVASAQRKGVIIVAAVGNDGPAAPPAYPASYPGVLAVTGVDRNNRALPEAGRASRTDFAAPGADIVSATGAQKKARVRGTSFAAPLVAARLSTFYPHQSTGAVEPAVRKLMAEAIDLGRKGHDPVYGHGLVCGKCGR